MIGRLARLTMVSSKTKFYAVRNGRVPGIYHSWTDCEAQVKHFSGAIFKSFTQKQEAVAFLQGAGSERLCGQASVGTKPGGTLAPSNRHPRGAPLRQQASAASSLAHDEAAGGGPASEAEDNLRIDATALYRLEFDGGSRGNGRERSCAGAGAVLLLHDSNQEVGSVCIGLGSTTNNVAEYSGLIAGLQAAAEVGVRRILVVGDSNLVVNQANGVYQVKNERLKELHQKLMDLRGRFDDFAIRHIPREENGRADALSNVGMDGRGWEGLKDPRGRIWIPSPSGGNASGPKKRRRSPASEQRDPDATRAASTEKREKRSGSGASANSGAGAASSKEAVNAAPDDDVISLEEESVRRSDASGTTEVREPSPSRRKAGRTRKEGAGSPGGAVGDSLATPVRNGNRRRGVEGEISEGDSGEAERKRTSRGKVRGTSKKAGGGGAAETEGGDARDAKRGNRSTVKGSGGSEAAPSGREALKQGREGAMEGASAGRAPRKQGAGVQRRRRSSSAKLGDG